MIKATYPVQCMITFYLKNSCTICTCVHNNNYYTTNHAVLCPCDYFNFENFQFYDNYSIVRRRIIFMNMLSFVSANTDEVYHSVVHFQTESGAPLERVRLLGRPV